MKNTSRIITGILLILAGIALGYVYLFINQDYNSLILGSISLIFGVIILVNKKEDKIEEIKKK
jgi:hypothetical protein